MDVNPVQEVKEFLKIHTKIGEIVLNSFDEYDVFECFIEGNSPDEYLTYAQNFMREFYKFKRMIAHNFGEFELNHAEEMVRRSFSVMQVVPVAVYTAEQVTILEDKQNLLGAIENIALAIYSKIKSM